MPMPSGTHDAEKQAVALALRDLEHSLELFIAALSHDGGPASTAGASGQRDAVRRICEAYAAIDYAPTDEVNQSPTCLGVVGASAAVIARATSVNKAKARLRAACAPIQDMRVRLPVKDGEGGRVVKPLPLVRVVLRGLQRSDLNLLAAYRKIPVLTGRIERVAYTQARTRAVYRKSRAEIAALLAAIDRPGVEEDRARLAKLPSSETHLALVREHYTNARANVWFHGLDTRNRGRLMIAAELPLLFPVGRSKDLPEIRYPQPTESTPLEPKARSGKLEDAAFLATLPVYRYRPEFR